MPCFSIRSKLLSEEIERSMEGAICQGWLTKSPPEKKMPGPRRIFPSKWRKRYFVLRMPPASVSLPGSCGLLEYYDSAHCTKRYGSIDLDQCEQVTVSLDTYDYRNLFALYSKHKGRSRTYYLAAENETAMNHWVECLCKVCGFKPEEDRPEDEWPTRPAPVPVQTDRYLPEPERVPFQERQSDMPDIVPRPVAPSDQAGHNYKPRRTTMDNTSSPGRAGNEVALDSIPPPPTHQAHRGKRPSVDSTDSIPDEPAPAPPSKGGPPRLDGQDGLHDPNTYDQPKSYTNLPPHQNPEGTYQVPPPPKHVNGTGRKHSVENMLVNVPPAAPTVYPMSSSKRDSNSSSGSRGSKGHGGSASSSEDTYDAVPPPRPYGVDRSKDPRLTGSGSLDHRTPGRRTGGGSQQKTDNCSTLLETVPAPSQDMHKAAEYINVPSNSVAFRNTYANLEEQPKHHRQQSPSVTSSTVSGIMDPTYDRPPPTRKEEVSGLIAKPPPPPHQVSMPQYVNAPNFKPTSDIFVPAPSQPVDDNVYLPMKPAPEKGVYLPMSPKGSSMQDSYVPPGGASGRDGAKTGYLTMGQYNSGGNGNVPVSSAVYRNKGGAITNDSVYLPMQRPESDTYMPMAPGSYDENYMPMVNNMERCSVNSVYTDMNSAGPPPSEQAPTQPSTHSIYEVPPSNKPVPVVPPRTTAITEPPRLQPQTSHPPTNVTDGALVFTSHRTKSFKREVPRVHKPPKPLPRSQPAQPDPPLPRKKTTASTGESSSSEDDDESISSLDRSSDTISVHKHSKVDMLSKSKKSLNSTPPPPKRPGEVQYLDLALEKGADTERSPVFPRSPPPPVSHRAASPTEYKEIDFVKTKALTEMKKDVESKRKSSEKSVDE